jgi:anti-sigma-K factor RskA
MQHEQVFEQLEEYVLGTMAPQQRREVETHLDSGCESCLARLSELGETAARMADALPRQIPSTDLKDRILGSIPPSASDTAPRPVQLWTGRAAALIATAAAVLLAVWTWNLRGDLSDLRTRLARSETETANLRQELETYKDATFLLGEPGMQFIDMAGVAPNEQAFGKVVIDPDRGAGIVYMYELPPTPEGMTYQLWVIREGKPTSAGMFTVNEDGSAMLSLETMPDLGTIASFDVTIEPAGGMPEPTGMMYLTSPGVLQSPEKK